MLPPPSTERNRPQDESASLTSVLLELIEKKSWAKALLRIETHPGEASIRKPGGLGPSNHPLHEACKLQPPASVIAALIKSHPPAVRSPDGWGYLPLHCACHSSSSIEVVSLLLSSHSAAARTRDKAGRLPLHLACQWGSSLEVIDAILAAHPEGIFVLDSDGRTPEDCLKQNIHPSMDSALRIAPRYCVVSKAATARTKDEMERKASGVEEAHAAHIAEKESEWKAALRKALDTEEGLRSNLEQERLMVSVLTERVDALERMIKEERESSQVADEKLRQEFADHTARLETKIGREKKLAAESKEELRKEHSDRVAILEAMICQEAEKSAKAEEQWTRIHKDHVTLLKDMEVEKNLRQQHSEHVSRLKAQLNNERESAATSAEELGKEHSDHVTIMEAMIGQEAEKSAKAEEEWRKIHKDHVALLKDMQVEKNLRQQCSEHVARLKVQLDNERESAAASAEKLRKERTEHASVVKAVVIEEREKSANAEEQLKRDIDTLRKKIGRMSREAEGLQSRLKAREVTIEKVQDLSKQLESALKSTNDDGFLQNA